MNKLFNSIKSIGRLLLTPITTAAGSIGGYEIGRFAATRAPRIATQLPYVGMGLGAVAGVVLGQELNERITGIRVRGNAVTIVKDSVVVKSGDVTVAGDEAKRAIEVLYPAFAAFTDAEIQKTVVALKVMSTRGGNPQSLTAEEIDVVAGSVSEAAA